MADVRYKPDFRDTGRLMRAATMHMAMIEVALEAIPFAQAISPDAPPYGEGYVDSFELDSGHTLRIAGTKRAEVRLYNTSDHAAAVEFGNENINAHHVLSLTADVIEGGF